MATFLKVRKEILYPYEAKCVIERKEWNFTILRLYSLNDAWKSNYAMITSPYQKEGYFWAKTE